MLVLNQGNQENQEKTEVALVEMIALLTKDKGLMMKSHPTPTGMLVVEEVAVVGVMMLVLLKEEVAAAGMPNLPKMKTKIHKKVDGVLVLKLSQRNQVKIKQLVVDGATMQNRIVNLKMEEVAGAKID